MFVLDVLRPATEPYHVETPQVQHRRRRVVVVTAVVGTALLGAALRTPHDSSAFYPLSLLLAATWVAGALLSGPLHLGWHRRWRDLAGPVVLGVGAYAVFAVGALVCRLVPFLAHSVSDVFDRASGGSLLLVLAVALLNGVAEELFFRGALYSAFGPRHPVFWTTLVYLVVTAAAGNVLLALAALVMGTLFALERRATRGVLASGTTHLVWSVCMLLLLPR